MGSFPSNFVIVLDESFQPASRAASPMPEASPHESATATHPRAVSPRPQKQKPAACRKPFQGYKKSTAPGEQTQSSSAPAQEQEEWYDSQNPPSTELWTQTSYSRGPSRSSSPMPQQDLSSSPPPPPPPHRVAVGSQLGQTPSPLPNHSSDQPHLHCRTPSPDIASINGHTPPMVRDAMDEVMSSLEGMRNPIHPPEQKAPFNPWSPEAFHDLQLPRSTRPNARPVSSLGLGRAGSDLSERYQYSSRNNSPERDGEGPPQLSNFVQRMESRLRQMQDEKTGSSIEDFQSRHNGQPPAVPAKDSPCNSRPVSSVSPKRPSLKDRKSAYELGRTRTTKSSATNTSSGVQSNATNWSTATSMTGQSVFSAGGISATSAASLARRTKFGSLNRRPMASAGSRSNELRPQTPLTGASYHSGHGPRQGAQSAVGWESRSAAGDGAGAGAGGLGGLTTPKFKKPGFFKKLLDGSKTAAASARSSIAVSQAGSTVSSPQKQRFNNGITGIAGGTAVRQNDPGAAKEMGLGGGNIDWVHVRRDVNRSNTPGPMERRERADRCQMLDHPVIHPIDELWETAEGDEGADGYPVMDAFQISNPSFSGVDKAARFITSLPPMITPASLAQGYVCRPHRSEVQRLRAIFTWASERIAWDEDFDGEIDSRRVIQTKRGCSHEVAVLVYEMCSAIGIHVEVVRGYLKTPGEDLDLDASINRPNHYWNAVVVDNEWRMLDCSIASPTNPKRSLYSSVSTSIAESFYFLASPLEFCYTHVPSVASNQHILPPISHDVLLSLPCALPPYFRQKLILHNYDTSLIRLEGLEIATLNVNVAPDVELVAEVETRSYLRDSDGDLYENGDAVVRKSALTQASWYSSASNPQVVSKRYTIKALLPSDEGMGVLKIYAGKRGLMHSSKDIPHPLAVAVPIFHMGDNPPYEFITRHPTPHAMRQDLYVVQPQCRRLVIGETFVFCVRQHGASTVSIPSGDAGGVFDSASVVGNRPVSPNPFARPASAMSMMSASVAGSGSDLGGASGNISVGVSVGTGPGVRVKDKPAKLAVQSPGGKILRLNRKAEHASLPSRGAGAGGEVEEVQGSVWETIVKVQERGVWRGLVLADRSARWCVWGEWECV
jgi:Transglutaminase-like superfamily